MSKENDIKRFREIAKQYRILADYTDKLADLSVLEETEEVKSEMEEVSDKCMLAAIKMQRLIEQP